MKNEEIQKASEVLRKGGIVIFPTDTAYGIGCRMDNEKAVEKLFEIRKRPKNQAVPVLIDSISMAEKYSKRITKKVRKLMENYWPGGLTIILEAKKELVPLLVRGGGETVGLRIPNHPIPLALIKRLNVPILGPSANFHGEKTPYSFFDLDPKIIKMVDYVIKGVCQIRKPSTVIDVSKNKWVIIRQGAVDIKL